VGIRVIIVERNLSRAVGEEAGSTTNSEGSIERMLLDSNVGSQGVLFIFDIVLHYTFVFHDGGKAIDRHDSNRSTRDLTIMEAGEKL
jgi:hypothetical protein